MATVDRHRRALVDDLDRPGPEPDMDLPTDQPGGHRVEAAPDPDPGLAVDLGGQRQRRVEGFGGQGPQGRALALEGLRHRLAATADAPRIVELVGGLEPGLQLLERRHLRDGHEVASAEAADVALDATLLVGTALSRQAAEAVEAIVAAQQREALRLDAVTADEDPSPRRP